MKVYTVRILDTVFADIGDIADYIVAVSTPEHAAKYARELQAEIMSLSYLAGIIPESRPVVADVPVVVRCVRCVGFAIRHLLLSGFVIRFDLFMTTTTNKEG